MSRLMYVVLIPIAALVVALFVRSAPPATASLDPQATPTLDVTQLTNEASIKRLPKTEIAEEYLH